MKISAIFPETRDYRRVVELARECEDAGLHGMWLGAAFGFDPLMALAHAGTATSRLLLGTSVLPTWPRHPLVMAQQAATANAMCGGRFRLGLGPSHVPVMQMYGIDFDRPVGHLREYLTVVKSLLRDGSVKHRGERFRVNGFLDVEGGGQPPVMLAALGEQTCRLAGELADAVLPWLPPPRYVAEAIVPWVQEGARKAGREAPPVIVSIPCVLSTDRDTVRDVVNGELAIYPRMPFYAALFQRAGVPDADDAMTAGWTDAMVDVIVPWGDSDAVAARVAEYAAAGANEVVLSPFGVEPEKSVEVLSDIAGG